MELTITIWPKVSAHRMMGLRANALTMVQRSITTALVRATTPGGEFHDQRDNVKKEYYKLIVTETTKYALRAGNSRVADRPARGWPPETCIIMIP
jgi:hypothetical protein